MENTNDRPRSLAERAQRFVPRRIRRTTRSFTLVLVLLAVIYVVAEIWSDRDVAFGFVWGCAYLAFLVTLRGLGAAPRTVYLNAAVMAVLFGLGLAGLALEEGRLTEAPGLAASLYAFVAPVLILRHVLTQRRITTEVIVGALVVYVFLGIDFGIVFDTMQRFDPNAFVVTAGGSSSVFYLSFVTLTTVGYGDITPASDLARALTVMESLSGQILLVVIVARLVGMQIAQSAITGGKDSGADGGSG